jgi:hypothetical protein
MSQDNEEDASMGDRRAQVDDALLARLRAVLDVADGAPEALVAAAKLSPDIVSLDEDYLDLVQSETVGAGAIRSGDARSLSFQSSECRLEVAVDELAGGVGDAGARTGVLVLEGRVIGTGAVEVVHETGEESLGGHVDDSGYFTITRVPRGFGRLVVQTTDGRRLPTTWIVF